MVVEAISSQSSSFDAMSVRLMDKGWAWLVSGRKLLVWKFKESKARTVTRARRTLSPCFELQLPQSDLIHRAELINVFFMPQNPNASLRAVTVPAALAISPEGTIRLWLNIANERFTESSVVDMQGQEFCTLAPLSQTEYLVGTTTGSVFLLVIDINASDHKSIISCTSLEAPSGILSGISRRMTNLFWGQMTTVVSSEARRPLIAVPQGSSSTTKVDLTEKTFFIMSSSLKLSEWSRALENGTNQNRLVRQWDLQKNIYNKLAMKLNIPESHRLNFWPVDMITTDSKELLLLIITLDTSRDNTINYATCRFNPYQSGHRIGKTVILRSHSWNYTNESEEQLLALRFLERQANSPLCFIYDRKYLFLARTDRDILDAVDYANQNDGILGAGFADGQPVLFTRRDGLICVAPIVADLSQVESHLNETSIQSDAHTTRQDLSILQQSRIESQQKSASNRIEPMLVELDDEVEEQQENKPKPSTIPKQRRDLDQSTTTGTNLDGSNLNRSTDQPSLRRKGDEVGDYLKDNKEFEWIQQIDSKRYDLASETLAKLADESEILKDRRETLLALSKLAKLAQ